MRLPNSARTWIIVMRHCRDTRSKGDIIKIGMSEQYAKWLVEEYKAKDNFNNYWAMQEEWYHVPFSC